MKKGNKNKNSKLWFNKECDDLKREKREKHGDPRNVFLREKFKANLKEYKRMCQSKRHLFWQNKFKEIETSLNNPKKFWETWKNCSEIQSSRALSPINEDEWYCHFTNLHAEKLDTSKQAMRNNPQPPCAMLNQHFTKKE